MAKKKDLFEEVNELQEKLMSMYKDRKDKGYKSDFLLSEIKNLEVSINEKETLLLKEEYDKDAFIVLRNQAKNQLIGVEEKELILLDKLDRLRRTKRLCELRSQSLTSILKEKEGDSFISEIDTKDIIKDTFKFPPVDYNLICLDLSIDISKVLSLKKEDFVLKMFSYLRGNKAFSHYDDKDLAILFYRNSLNKEGKRLSFKDIKETYYVEGKTAETYTKLYKILKDKIRKNLKIKPDDLIF